MGRWVGVYVWGLNTLSVDMDFPADGVSVALGGARAGIGALCFLHISNEKICRYWVIRG